MSISKIHTVFSIFLVLALMLSSLNINIDTHYCQNQLKGISLLGKAKSCHEKKTTCPLHQELTKNNCCSNKTISLKALDKAYDMVDALQIPSLIVSLPEQVKLELPKTFYRSNTSTTYQHYRPPTLIQDAQSQFSTYLI